MENLNESDEKKRNELLASWRSLNGVSGNLPEDLIADELNAASDAADLETPMIGMCWQRSRCPMPRLRISTGMEERLIPWYSVLEVRVDSNFRMFEILLAGGTICRIFSRRPQKELYANFQLERIKVIYPIECVTVSFEDVNEKKSAPDFSGTDR